MTTMRQIPAECRPRERLARLGPAKLSEMELLAILLRTGTRQQSALGLAQEVLAQCKDLEGLAAAGHTQLQAIRGMGQSKAAQILAALELGKRVLGNGKKPRQRLSSPHEVHAYVRGYFQGLGKEHFVALYLDSKNRLLGEETVSIGILDSSQAHPREIFHGAVTRRAKSLIVAHNHPSGDPAPSREDMEITKRLREAGRILGIALLDHVIVGSGACVSMREEGYWEQ